MQIGSFTVGDVTVGPTTRTAPTEHLPIKAMVTIARLPTTTQAHSG